MRAACILGIQAGKMKVQSSALPKADERPSKSFKCLGFGWRLKNAATIQPLSPRSSGKGAPNPGFGRLLIKFQSNDLR